MIYCFWGAYLDMGVFNKVRFQADQDLNFAVIAITIEQSSITFFYQPNKDNVVKYWQFGKAGNWQGW